jgi:hypothetical protein
MVLVCLKAARASAVDLISTNANVRRSALVAATLEMRLMLVFALFQAASAHVESAEMMWRGSEVPLQRSLESVLAAARPSAEVTARGRMVDRDVAPKEQKSARQSMTQRRVRKTYAKALTSGAVM